MTAARFLLALVLLPGWLLPARGADAAGDKPAPDARWGNVLYRTPEPGRWQMRDRADRREFTAKLKSPSAG